MAILIAEWGERATSLYVIQFVHFLDENDYSPDVTMVRASADNVSNGHGVKLIDLCKSKYMRIVNCRIGQINKYTCFKELCVCDFLVTREHNFPCIHDFTLVTLLNRVTMYLCISLCYQKQIYGLTMTAIE